MKPELGIVNEYPLHDKTVLIIDTCQATYQGRKWEEMGDYWRRKFENYIVISRPKEKLLIHYRRPAYACDLFI